MPEDPNYTDDYSAWEQWYETGETDYEESDDPEPDPAHEDLDSICTECDGQGIDKQDNLCKPCQGTGRV